MVVPAFGKHKGKAAEADVVLASEDQFTPPEVDWLRFAFNDRAKRGLLQSSDLTRVLKRLGIVPTAQELEEFKASMDPEKTGTIDFPSFFSVLANSLKPVYSDKMLNSAFAHVLNVPESAVRDDTLLTSRQLLACLRRLGQTGLTEDDCDDIVREMDTAGRGGVSRADFKQAMQHH